jgi:hypothetical protein
MKMRTETIEVDTTKTSKIAADLFQRLLNRTDLDLPEIIAVALNFQAIFENCLNDLDITISNVQRV